MERRGVRADVGRTKGVGGGMDIAVSALVGEGRALVRGDMGCSQLQQLLALEERVEDVGEGLSAGMGPDVEVAESLEAAEVVEVVDVVEAIEYVEDGRFSPKVNLVLAPVDRGLMSTGESVLRKSR